MLALRQGRVTQARTVLASASRARTRGTADLRVARGTPRHCCGWPTASRGRRRRPCVRAFASSRSTRPASGRPSSARTRHGIAPTSSLWACGSPWKASGRAPCSRGPNAAGHRRADRAGPSVGGPGARSEPGRAARDRGRGRGGAAAGRNPDAALRRQVQLEEAVRDRVRQRPGRGSGRGRAPVRRGPGARTRRRGTRGVRRERRLPARRHRGRRPYDPAPPRPQRAAYALLPYIPFALRRLGRPGAGPARAAACDLLAHVGKRLDTALLAPLAAQVRDRPLVLVPTGPLQWLPWSLLPSCRGRAGERGAVGDPLAPRCGRRGAAPGRRGGRRPDLPHAPTRHALSRRCTRVPSCSTERWPTPTP
jgi:hypothetical protein